MRKTFSVIAVVVEAKQSQSLLLTSHRSLTILVWISHRRIPLAADKSTILQGTLDLMVLKTLDAMGPLHGYGIARRIEQISQEALQINQGTIYASLVRLMQKGWISGAWGTSDNNRKAKFYSITKAGRKQLHAEAENWERISGVIGRVLRIAERG
jgi:PadR family transcriptional regulator, regulatory protein PadR